MEIPGTDVLFSYYNGNLNLVNTLGCVVSVEMEFSNQNLDSLKGTEDFSSNQINFLFLD